MTSVTSCPVDSCLTSLIDAGAVRRVVETPVVGVEHDARARTGLAGEAILQDVGRVLRLDPWDAEGVVVLATGAALHRHDDERGHEPEPEHPERVAGAAAAEAVQKCTHVSPPELRPHDAGRTQDPRTS